MVKSVLEETPHKREYPYLGRYIKEDRNFIVLFSNDSTGTVVWSSRAEYPVGHWDTNWAEWIFTPMAPGATVTLSA